MEILQIIRNTTMATKKAKKIYSTNTEALQAAISEAEGRATARTLSAQNANDALEEVVFSVLHRMPKKHPVGCRATVHASTERLPRAYKYRAESTYAHFVHDGKGWLLESVERDTLVQRAVRYGVELVLTDDAKKFIIDQCTFV